MDAEFFCGEAEYAWCRRNAVAVGQAVAALVRYGERENEHIEHI